MKSGATSGIEYRIDLKREGATQHIVQLSGPCICRCDSQLLVQFADEVAQAQAVRLLRELAERIDHEGLHRYGNVFEIEGNWFEVPADEK